MKIFAKILNTIEIHKLFLIKLYIYNNMTNITAIIQKYYNKIMSFFTKNKKATENDHKTGIWFDEITNTVHFYKDGEETEYVPYKPLAFDDLTDEQKTQLKGEKGDKGDPGTFDEAALENYMSKDDLKSFLLNIQNYVEDNGSYPTIEKMEEWENKEDILKFDYDLDGIFSIVDLYLPEYILLNGSSKLGDSYNSQNLTYNGKSLDINGDHSITVSELAELSRNLVNYRNSSKIDLSYKNIEDIKNIINSLTNSLNHYPTYNELKNHLKILKYDYDNDGIISSTDMYLPLFAFFYYTQIKNDPKLNIEAKTYNGHNLLIEGYDHLDVVNFMKLVNLKEEAKKNGLTSIIDPSIDDNDAKNKIIQYVTQYGHYPTFEEFNHFFNIFKYNWNQVDLVCEYTINDPSDAQLFNSNINIEKTFNHIYIDDTEISLSNINDGKYTFNNPGTYIVKFDLKNKKSIPESMFIENKNLKNVILPMETESIGNNAFKECSNLKAIVMLNPNTVVDWEATSSRKRAIDNVSKNKELIIFIDINLFENNGSDDSYGVIYDWDSKKESIINGLNYNFSFI